MDAIETLTQLGLNQLEAEIYCHLLQHEATTPYKVAQALGRQTANVYKAVEILARRGAVVVEEGESRTCRAVPVREFLRHTERAFLETTKSAAEQLAGHDRPQMDDRVYRIDSADAVFERARTMLEHEATDLAVVDAFPAALEAIRKSIQKAIRRGIRVQIQAYAPVTFDGAASLVIPAVGGASVAMWQSQQLNIVIDGRQSLLALLSTELDRVHQAIWSHSLYLSSLLHAGMTSEQTIHHLTRLVDAKRSPTAVARAIRGHRFFLNSHVPGQQELLARFKGEVRGRRKA
jgi:sugar-specific transcriptional regulator TrmB